MQLSVTSSTKHPQVLRKCHERFISPTPIFVIFVSRNVLGVHLNTFSAAQGDMMAFMHNILGSTFPSVFLDEVDAEIVKNNSPVLDVIQEMGYFLLQATKPDTAGR